MARHPAGLDHVLDPVPEPVPGAALRARPAVGHCPVGTRGARYRPRAPVAARLIGPLALLVLLVLLGGVAGCAASDASLGSMTIHLVGQAPSGTVYRLRHAAISVTGGPTTRIWNTEDDLERTSLSDDVAVGNYVVSVAPGWSLERLDGSSVTPVIAQLISDNPASFTVAPHQRTTVPLRFHVDGEDIDLAQGYEIVVAVEETAPQLIVVANSHNFESGSITVYAASANGDVAPLRTIAGPRTMLTEPDGVAVTADEIIVCDAFAVSVFPLRASGDIAPTRQITGSETDIVTCLDVAVANEEIYVADLNELLVFPVTANGNITPSRRIRGFSFADSLAVEGGELYVADSGGVFVFSLPLTEDAEPVRFISSRCASGIALDEGELVVGDDCLPGLHVYPADADGEVAPLRTLSGPDTGIAGPEQVARFRDHLYVAHIDPDRVLVFAETAAGNTAPLRSIGGPGSGVVAPSDVAVR